MSGGRCSGPGEYRSRARAVRIRPSACSAAARPSTRCSGERCTTNPGIESITGHADRVLVDGSRVTGVEVDGRPVTADLVVDASGRGHLSVPLRGTPEGGSCGLSYIARLYRLRDGAEPGPRNTPIGYAISRAGYQQIVFQHDNGYFNVLLVRATSDKDLAELRHESRWNAAIGLFAGAGAWIDPERAEPAGPVRAGAGLTNTYLGQAVGLTGLLAIGDAVATTNPTGGRGVSLGISSAEAMTRIVENSPRECWATELDAWCEDNLRRWVTDQIEMDAAMLRRGRASRSTRARSCRSIWCMRRCRRIRRTARR